MSFFFFTQNVNKQLFFFSFSDQGPFFQFFSHKFINVCIVQQQKQQPSSASHKRDANDKNNWRRHIWQSMTWAGSVAAVLFAQMRGWNLLKELRTVPSTTCNMSGSSRGTVSALLLGSRTLLVYIYSTGWGGLKIFWIAVSKNLSWIYFPAFLSQICVTAGVKCFDLHLKILHIRVVYTHTRSFTHL